jgi:hypothetical protein
MIDIMWLFPAIGLSFVIGFICGGNYAWKDISTNSALARRLLKRAEAHEAYQEAIKP